MIRKDQPFDVVEKPKHYNSHPSGVETKEVTNYLSFNIGNVLKYVMRRDLKEPLRSLKSAQWYLREHLECKMPSVVGNALQVDQKLLHISACEASLVDYVFYLSFRRYLLEPSKFNEVALVVSLDNVLEKAQSIDPPKT